MFIKFKKSVADWKSGDVVEFNDETIARAYITGGLADESNAQDYMNSLVRGHLDEATKSLKEDLASLTRTVMDGATSNGPPSKGVKFDKDGVPFDKIENGTAEADRNAKGTEQTSFAECLRLIYIARSKDFDDNDTAHANKRLAAHYITGVSRTEHDEWETNRSFNMVDGKPINRTGTESMTGGATLGYLVRPEYMNTFFRLAMEDQVIESAAKNLPIGQSNTFEYPALDQYFTPAKGQSAVYGGVQVYRKGETDPRVGTDFKLRNIQYKMTDLTGFGDLSRDLLMDNFLAADQILQDVYGKAMMWRKDWEFLNGDGVGKPLGILNSGALLTVTRGTSSHIEFADLVNMFAAFHMASLKNAVWLANQTTIKDLMAIVDHSSVRVFQPNSGITQATSPSIIDKTTSNGMKYAAQGTLMGLPIRFTEKLPPLGTSGDLILIDPTQYGVATRQNLEIGVSEHFKFNQDLISYRFKLRNDGQPLWLGPYTSADSAGTKFSPFIKIS